MTDRDARLMLLEQLDADPETETVASTEDAAAVAGQQTGA